MLKLRILVDRNQPQVRSAVGSGVLKLRILVDRNSIEVFANDGEVYMPIGVIHP